MQTRTRFIISACFVIACCAGAASASLDEGRMESDAKRFDRLADAGDETPVLRELSKRYAKLAGSATNALRLVTGLRSGTTIRLQLDDQRPVEIRPSVGKLSYGRVSTVLGRAENELAQRRGNVWPAAPKDIDRAVRDVLASLPANGPGGEKQVAKKGDPDKKKSDPGEKTYTEPDPAGPQGCDGQGGGQSGDGGHDGGGGGGKGGGKHDGRGIDGMTAENQRFCDHCDSLIGQGLTVTVSLVKALGRAKGKRSRPTRILFTKDNGNCRNPGSQQ